MKILTTLLLSLLSIIPGLSQQTGKVDYPYLGVSFTIPSGWLGQEVESGYIMGSNTEAGFILMMTHEAKTLDELKREASKGIQEEGGTALSLAGDIQQVGPSGVGAQFSGTLEWNPATAYIVGVINPFGYGVTVIAVTNPPSYSTRYEELAREVANSIQFAKPKESPVVKEWKEALKGAKLTYLSSYDGSGYGSYGGTSTTREILLCSDGSFSYYYNSSMSLDTGGASAFSNSNDGGQGSWSVETATDGEAILMLEFTDGREFSYDIGYKDNKTFLNDTRYFRTYDHGSCR